MPWKCFMAETEADRRKVGAVWPYNRGWSVRLPGLHAFWSKRIASDGKPWDVNGEPPNVTVSPSINLLGVWHGWIRNGVITDDCEGRRYDADGRLLT